MRTVHETLDVRPWNEVYYKDCLYNPLISAICYLGYAVEPLLANELFHYSYSAQFILPVTSVSIEFVPVFRLLSGIGVGAREFKGNLDLHDLIRKAVAAKRLVLVNIDRFMWDDPRRNEIYQKEHHEHTFLIHGFDDGTQEYDIVDVGGNGCFRDRILYRRLEDGYASHKAFFQDRDPLNRCVGAWELGTERVFSAAPLEEYAAMYVSNLRAHDCVRGASDAALLDLIAFLEGEHWRSIDVAATIKTATHIYDLLHHKEVEAYRNRTLFPGNAVARDAGRDITEIAKSIWMLTLKLLATREIRKAEDLDRMALIMLRDSFKSLRKAELRLGLSGLSCYAMCVP
jgi:hypothetical protein